MHSNVLNFEFIIENVCLHHIIRERSFSTPLSSIARHFAVVRGPYIFNLIHFVHGIHLVPFKRGNNKPCYPIELLVLHHENLISNYQKLRRKIMGPLCSTR